MMYTVVCHRVWSGVRTAWHPLRRGIGHAAHHVAVHPIIAAVTIVCVAVPGGLWALPPAPLPMPLPVYPPALVPPMDYPPDISPIPTPIWPPFGLMPYDQSELGRYAFAPENALPQRLELDTSPALKLVAEVLPPVPTAATEPSALAIFGLAVAVLVCIRRHSKQNMF